MLHLTYLENRKNNNMSNVKKRPEVLSPAGTLEKLKVAIDYGADAVFVGGQAYGLRSRAGNFSMEELQEGIDYAHKYGAKVYVAANMVTMRATSLGLVSGSVNCVIWGLMRSSFQTRPLL